jgi:hypothetical protein
MIKKVSTLNEDSQMLYNKWVRGIATRELQPEIITLSDIVNRFRNNNKAPKKLPYPLDSVVDFLGDIFVKCADLRRTLAQGVVSPLIKDKASKIKTVRDLNKKIERIQQQIFDCTEDLNKLLEK